MSWETWTSIAIITAFLAVPPAGLKLVFKWPCKLLNNNVGDCVWQ